jgi:hypothetical protein
MGWMLAGDWPVGATLIPSGTVIDSTTWNGPLPLPINALALDDEAALHLAMAYEETASINGWHQLHFAPGVDREAVMAKARNNKRWPNGVPSNLAVKEEKPGPGRADLSHAQIEADARRSGVLRCDQP